MNVRFTTSERGHPDMGGNNRGAHLLGQGGQVSAWAPTDAEAKRALVKVARKLAMDLNKWCNEQQEAKP